MSKDNKDDGYNEDPGIYRDKLISECLIRITALENLLILKNIVTDKEIQEQLKVLSNKIADLIGTPFLTEAEDDNFEDDVSNSEYEEIFQGFALTTRKISKGN